MRDVRLATPLTARRVRASLIAGVVVLADQITKMWARAALEDHDIDLIRGFLRFRLTENHGSAFSLLQGSGRWLGLAAVAASALILVAVERTENRIELAGFSLILGGAVGNLADRLLRGAWLGGGVTDFVDFNFWPTFNVADSAITVGVALILWAARRKK